MPNTQNRTTQRNNDEFRFDMIEHIGVFGTRPETGWTREANVVSWNGGVAKVDIRDWDSSHLRMSKGITLYEDEAQKLAEFLGVRYGLLDGFPAEEEKHREETGPVTSAGPVVPAEAAAPTGSAELTGSAENAEEEGAGGMA